MTAAIVLLSLVLSTLVIGSEQVPVVVCGKDLGRGQRLAVLKKEASADVLHAKLARLGKETSTTKSNPLRCFTYSVELRGPSAEQSRILLARDEFVPTTSYIAGYTGPLEPQFLDVGYSETNATLLLLLKRYTLVTAEIVQLNPATGTTANSTTNILAWDLPTLSIIESGQVDCANATNITIKLKNSREETARFAWRDGTWKLEWSGFSTKNVKQEKPYQQEPIPWSASDSETRRPKRGR
jgi:hypothetical protein